MNPLKPIATYSRVSTLRQEDEQTIHIQLNTLREHAEKNGYTIVKEYTDDGWSGDILIRPALDDLRNDAKKKLWEAVLIYDPDRLARRYSYQELVMDELREAGIEVLFVTISTPKNSEDKILHGVRGLFAEYERTKIAERFRLGKLRKIKEGHILVADPLYGYTYIPKADHRHGYYVINEEEAAVVKMIFAWMADEGLTLRKITERLMAMGIKPRKSARGVWSTSTLSRMFRHRAYIGEARWGSSYAVVPEKPRNTEKYKRMKKSSRKIRPQSEWYIVRVPVILSEELFNRAQAKLNEHSRLSQRNTKNPYLLSGLIKCICGSARGGEGPKKGKHLYYRCTDRNRCHPLPRTCNEKGINAKIADELVWNRIAQLMCSPELLKKQTSRWIENKRDKNNPFIVDVNGLKKQVVKLKEEENRYNKAYGGGLFTLAQLKEYTDPLKTKIAGLEEQIHKAHSMEHELHLDTIPSETELQSFSEEVIKSIKNLNFDAKKAIVRSVIDKVVGNTEQLTVCGYIPIEEHVNVITDHRHTWNINRHASKFIPFSFTVKLPPPQNLFGNK